MNRILLRNVRVLLVAVLIADMSATAPAFPQAGIRQATTARGSPFTSQALALGNVASIQGSPKPEMAARVAAIAPPRNESELPPRIFSRTLPNETLVEFKRTDALHGIYRYEGQVAGYKCKFTFDLDADDHMGWRNVAIHAKVRQAVGTTIGLWLAQQSRLIYPFSRMPLWNILVRNPTVLEMAYRLYRPETIEIGPADSPHISNAPIYRLFGDLRILPSELGVEEAYKTHTIRIGQQGNGYQVLEKPEEVSISFDGLFLIVRDVATNQRLKNIMAECMIWIRGELSEPVAAANNAGGFDSPSKSGWLVPGLVVSLAASLAKHPAGFAFTGTLLLVSGAILSLPRWRRMFIGAGSPRKIFRRVLKSIADRSRLSLAYVFSPLPSGLLLAAQKSRQVGIRFVIAAPEHEEQMISLFHEAFSKDSMERFKKALVEAFSRNLMNARPSHFLLAMDGSKVVGMGKFSSISGGLDGYLSSLAVAESYKGRGLAKTLMVEQIHRILAWWPDTTGIILEAEPWEATDHIMQFYFHLVPYWTYDEDRQKPIHLFDWSLPGWFVRLFRRTNQGFGINRYVDPLNQKFGQAA